MGSEDAEQAALIEWVAWAKHSIPELELLFAIPNGGKRHIATAVRLKKTGAKRGVLDLMLPVSKHGYHGLFLEMKVGENDLTPEQKEFKKGVEEQGYFVIVAWNWEEGRDALLWYVNS
jgi:hypothetical protein